MVLPFGVNDSSMVLPWEVACLRRLYTMLLWRSHGAAMKMAYTPPWSKTNSTNVQGSLAAVPSETCDLHTHLSNVCNAVYM